ncbi:MAG: hypothetical protein AAF456_18785, partial [Planctomycetota bacterium]
MAHSEIDSCLAYHVLRYPSGLISEKTLSNLACFLSGATFRAVLKLESFPVWRIEGALAETAFFKTRFDIETEFTGWQRALEDTSGLPTGFMQELGSSAEQWHLENGVDKARLVRLYFYSSQPIESRESDFWEMFLERPVMHYGVASG